MPRLVRVFAGRTLILLVLSCRGSYSLLITIPWQLIVLTLYLALVIHYSTKTETELRCHLQQNKARYKLHLCHQSSIPSMHTRDSQKVRGPFNYVRIILSCFHSLIKANIRRSTAKPTKWHVRPAKTQNSVGIRPIRSESSLSAWRNIRYLATNSANSKDFDQTIQMHSLIRVFVLGAQIILLVLSIKRLI